MPLPSGRAAAARGGSARPAIRRCGRARAAGVGPGPAVADAQALPGRLRRMQTLCQLCSLCYGRVRLPQVFNRLRQGLRPALHRVQRHGLVALRCLRQVHQLLLLKLLQRQNLCTLRLVRTLLGVQAVRGQVRLHTASEYVLPSRPGGPVESVWGLELHSPSCAGHKSIEVGLACQFAEGWRAKCSPRRGVRCRMRSSGGRANCAQVASCSWCSRPLLVPMEASWGKGAGLVAQARAATLCCRWPEKAPGKKL